VHLVGFIIRIVYRCQVKEWMEKLEIGLNSFQTIVDLHFRR